VVIFSGKHKDADVGKGGRRFRNSSEGGEGLGLAERSKQKGGEPKIMIKKTQNESEAARERKGEKVQRHLTAGKKKKPFGSGEKK